MDNTHVLPTIDRFVEGSFLNEFTKSCKCFKIVTAVFSEPERN